MSYKKKLIEVALPLEAINAASAREKSIRHGHPSTLHLWWARRPLAAARAVIFAQMVDDPSGHPDLFPTEFAQKKERGRLFKIIEELVKWENTTNEEVLQKARDAIWQSWRYTCAENADHPRAKELFDRHVLPAFHDPFAGGGALPLEAQRLGLESYASDLNPVAVLINKAMIEIPPRFAGKPPVNPDVKKRADLAGRVWKGAQGLAEDVRYYGQWMRDEAEKRIGHLYPKIEVTAEMVNERPDLKPYLGQQLSVIAWLWARTVKSPNPAFANVDVPLASTFMLSTKAGKEAYVEPVIEGGSYRFTVKVGKPKNSEASKKGTKLARANFVCLMSGTPISGDYIKTEAMAGRMGSRMIAIAVDGGRGRFYIAPTTEQEEATRHAQPNWVPDIEISGTTQYLGIKPYGMEQFAELFTARQLVALATFSDLVSEARKKVSLDAQKAGLSVDGKQLDEGGNNANAYADAVSVYLACACDYAANYWSSLATPADGFIRGTYAMQALQMSWDYAEAPPFGSTSGNWLAGIEWIAKAMSSLPARPRGQVIQSNAATQDISASKIVSTDPPYYDNVPYADLSDYFYVWLRRTLRATFPSLFATLAVPKAEELVAFAYRHRNGKLGAEAFFLNGMTDAMRRLSERSHPAFPVTIYYAFKQSESNDNEGTTNTGWDTFLAAIIEAGFAITGTWPMRTEREARNRSIDSNALASSIVLVCRPRSANAPTATRRDFHNALKTELPAALAYLQASNIAPVDLAQAAIGPGMAVYTRYGKVLNAEGQAVSVRAALAMINAEVEDFLSGQDSDFDADTRWAITWFDQRGFATGPAGEAILLSTAKGTALNGLEQAGIVESGRGEVRLLKPSELPADWDPTTDTRLTVWEMVHHLVRVLEAGGESAAAALVAKVGSQAEITRELCYRLYTLCEKKKRANDAMAYNGLVQSWPEIVRLAREVPRAGIPSTADLFDQD
jgi:putative DNA methylase